MIPDVVSIGEPLLEFNAIEPGSLREVRQYEMGWGGDTSNFSIAVCRMGGSAGYICRLGNDEFGDIFLDLWQAEGVDTKHVIREDGAQTGVYFVSRMGDTHSFTYYRKNSAASHISPRDVPRDYIQSARLLHASGIGQAISNNACDAVFYAIDLAREAGVLVSYDPNVRLKLWEERRARSIIMESIGLADFVFPSLEDAITLTGLKDPKRIALRLLERGPKVVALKMGGHGALLATSGKVRLFRSFNVKVVDTTGAGDAFDGAFVVSYLKGCSLEECVMFANAAAALTSTGRGAVKPIPKKSDVEALLSKQKVSSF